MMDYFDEAAEVIAEARKEIAEGRKCLKKYEKTLGWDSNYYWPLAGMTARDTGLMEGTEPKNMGRRCEWR